MNVGFIFLILLAIIAGVFGMIFVASHTSTSIPADSYGRMPDDTTNMTELNVTNTMPTGINAMGFVAIIAAFLAIVVVVMAIVFRGGKGYSTRL